jgi:polysaccharide export outer membrane protein
MNKVVLALLSTLLLGAPLSAQNNQSGEYHAGPKDLFDIRVLEIPELNVERRVTDAGKIDLPLVGEVDVMGLTATDIRDRLVALLTAKYVNRANVSVVIKEFASRPISVLGAVMRPGSLQISGRWDIQQAILAAGGLASNAGRKIFVLRRSENGLSDRLEIDTADLFQRSSAVWNIPIFPSDIVNIPGRAPMKIFTLGEFKSPGAIEFDNDDRVTLLTLIAKAGGLTDRAARGGIRIKRRTPDGKDTEIKADYKKIISGKEPDPELKADDVVIVKESLF